MDPNKKPIYKQICRYFDGKVIGSYIFVIKGFIPETDVNDIDIAIKSHALQNVRSFLLDNDFKETDPFRRQPGYADFEGSKEFIKEGEKTIHLLEIKDDIKVYSIPELIAKKYERGYQSDLAQITKVIANTKFKDDK